MPYNYKVSDSGMNSSRHIFTSNTFESLCVVDDRIASSQTVSTLYPSTGPPRFSISLLADIFSTANSLLSETDEREVELTDEK